MRFLRPRSLRCRRAARVSATHARLSRHPTGGEEIAGRSTRGDRRARTNCQHSGKRRTPVETPSPWSAEAREIAPLLETQQLVRSGSFTVFWADASQAPRLLDRIAVERELAFRAVGEGTGRDRDRDVFDDRYLHLCAWDHARHELVGAYRLGCSTLVHRRRMRPSDARHALHVDAVPLRSPTG